jgi:uncharacterized protein with GYD domain
MPKFLFRASYTASGAGGVLKEGGSGREAAIRALAESVGGTLLATYWVMGEDDIILITEMPDAEAAAAVSLIVGASGAATITTSRLFTAAEVDDIVARRPNYRAPGG